MSVEALLLGLLSGVRPSTASAAVVALLGTLDPRGRLLLFTTFGLGVSCAIGLLVVGVTGGVTPSGAAAWRGWLELAAGFAALGLAGWTLAGGRPGGSADPRPSGGTRGAAFAQRVRDTSPRGAAVAGVMTHLPGLVYLAALDAIAVGRPRAADAVAQVVAYNLLWFMVPLVTLAVAVRRPALARERMKELEAYGRRHRRVLTVALFGGVGAYLVGKGALRVL